MSFQPDGILYLIGGLAIDNTYSDVIGFPDAASQLAYFQSKAIDTLTQYSYMRKDSSIKVPINIESLYSVNYVMYRNTAGKWIYAFVTEQKYVNENNTELKIETDVYQTWLFDAQLLTSFVVREHVTDDSIGANLVDEGLDTGEYVRAASYASGKLDSFKIVVAVSYDATLNTAQGAMYAGVYSGLSYLVYGVDDTSIANLNTFIKNLAGAGKSSMIASIFMMPTNFVTTDKLMPMFYNISPAARPTTFEGYTPKNNKLYCYPYAMLFVSNNQGSGAVYRYEYMTNKDAPSFKIIGDLSPTPSVYLMPTNYKGLPTNAEEKLVLNNFPQCSWNNDLYANWLGSNKTSLTTGTAVNAAMAIGGFLSGETFMAAMGAQAVMGELAQVSDRSVQPAHAAGNIGGSSALSVGIQDFFFLPTTIRKEYAQRIDSFFDMFGYKVNTVKLPNTNTRPYWNYVQTKDVNIKASIPMEDLNKLKAMYNRGVTIWHGGDNIGNYALNNH